MKIPENLFQIIQKSAYSSMWKWKIYFPNWTILW